MNNFPIDWYAVTYSAGSSSAFGVYDSDPVYVTQSQRLIKYVVRSLGWPVMQIQILPDHVFTAFESAIMKYTAIVNQVVISDNMLNVYGQSPDADLTKAGIYGNLSSIIQISSMYGQEAIIRQSLHTEIYTATVSVETNKQQYDLSECIPHYTNSNVQLLQVYHFPRLYRTAMLDPMVNPGFNMASVMTQFGGVYQSNARLIIMPVFETLLKLQTLQLTDTIRRSHFGFELRKNKLILMPTPTLGQDVLIDYVLRSDKYDNSVRPNVVNSIANYPILTNLPYRDINTVGRTWIYRYTLALVKQILGLVRSKYSAIPYPQGQQTLDGQTLRNEAVAEQERLVQQLKLILEQTTMHRLIEKKREMSENLQIINSKIPLRIYIG